MSERIISKPPTEAYRSGLDRIFGKKSKDCRFPPHWYKIFLCWACGAETKRIRVLGEKPKRYNDRYSYDNLCGGCSSIHWRYR